MFPNKCLSREEAVRRYGPIDLAHGHWPNQSQWMTMLEIPQGWFPDWCVADSKVPVTHIFLNKDIHDPLLAALTNIHNLGIGHELKTYDGCFNVRPVRGSSLMSTHAYGLGLDFNAATNPMSSVLHSTWSQAFIKCMTDQGFAWGGNFHGRKDPMHWSYAWEG